MNCKVSKCRSCCRYQHSGSSRTMASFVSSSFVLLLVLCVAGFGNTRPQHFVSFGNRFFIVPSASGSQASHGPSTPIILAKASTNPSISSQVYVLRRKTPNTNGPLPMITNDHQSNFNQQNIPKSYFPFPIVSPNQNSNNRNNEALNSWKSLAINNVHINKNPVSRLETIYNADSAIARGALESQSSSKDFRSNIPLPQNPFLPKASVSSPFGSIVAERSDTPMENYNSASPQVPLVNGGLQNMLNKYLEDMYQQKYANVPAAPNSAFDQTSFMNFDHSRVDDGFSLYGQNEPQPNQYNYNADAFLGAHSGQVPFPQEAQSRVSIGKVSYTSVLEKARRAHHLKEVFPPIGSYTPYGERTILMVKYPGMPVTSRPGGNYFDQSGPGGKTHFSLKNVFNPYKDKDLEIPGSRTLKSPDFGVIVSQNFILKPIDGPGPSQFEKTQDGDSSSPDNLVSQLAKALAERNRIINAYSSSPMSNGKNVVEKPPFVLIHLESFTKKSNKTGRFGFDDEEVDQNYSNGTIIYPTKNNPNILASTKFEFDNIADVVFLFDRPLEGYQNGRIKPIVPVGIEDIKMFLKLVYEVHRDGHNGGKNKVAALKDLSTNSPKQSMMDSRPKDFNSQGRFHDNWLHTSSIGLRSLG